MNLRNLELITHETEIPTPDGRSDGFAVFPAEDGRYPAVRVCMDGVGLRPALVALLDRAIGAT